jgi:hypothetical protein
MVWNQAKKDDFLNLNTLKSTLIKIINLSHRIYLQ